MSLRGALIKGREDDWRWLEIDEDFKILARHVNDERTRKLASRSTVTSVRQRQAQQENIDANVFLMKLIEYAVKDWSVTYGVLAEVIPIDKDFLAQQGAETKVPFSHDDCYMVANHSSAFTDVFLRVVKDPKNFIDVPQTEEQAKELEEETDPTET